MKKKTEVQHPSEDRGERFPIDQVLRSNGYKIASRVNGQMPLWYDPEGRIVNQDDALRRICG